MTNKELFDQLIDERRLVATIEITQTSDPKPRTIYTYREGGDGGEIITRSRALHILFSKVLFGCICIRVRHEHNTIINIFSGKEETTNEESS